MLKLWLLGSSNGPRAKVTESTAASWLVPSSTKMVGGVAVPVKFAVFVPVRQPVLVKLRASGLNENPAFDGVT